MRSLLATALLAASAVSQTFIVDAGNGPGTNFTSIAAALAVVPEGATLLVRSGSYSGFAVTRSVAILGDSGVAITGRVQVTATTAQQPVTLRNLQWPGFANNQQPLELDSCGGAVLLENLQLPPSPCVPNPIFPGCSWIAGLTAHQCDQLTIRNCTLHTIFLNSCDSVLESTTCLGQPAGVINPSNGQIAPATAAIVLTAGRLQIVGGSTRVVGGDGISGGLVQAWAAPAVRTSGNVDLRLLDGTLAGGLGGGPFGCCGAEAVRGQNAGIARIDPRVVLMSQQTNPVAGIAVVNGPMPAVTSTGGTAGGSLSAVVDAEIGAVVVLVVGFPGPATTMPPFADPFWFDPTAYAFLAFGVQSAGQPIQGSVALPPSTMFEGLRLNWQAVAIGLATGNQASNPSVSLVR